MMSVQKNHIAPVITVCILAVILVIVLYFVIFFNKSTILCDSKEKLTGLMRKDFSNVEIIDIQHKLVKDKAIGVANTQIFVFLKESGKLESNEYYFDSNGGGILDPNMGHVPPGNIADLKEIGIELPQIQRHGGIYNQIKVGFSIVPYTIHWYQIDESYDGASNVVLFASVPRKVSINVNEIIQ